MGSVTTKLGRRLSEESARSKRQEMPHLSEDEGTLIKTVWQSLKREIANIGTITFVW